MSEPLKTESSIYITDENLDRLERLIATSSKTLNILNLEEELGRAIIVARDEVPPHVVTMGSKVRYRDEFNGEESVVTLVYPSESDVNQGKISVLAPIGSALLGLTAGSAIQWPMPNGRIRLIRIVEVLHQPESAAATETNVANG